MRTAIVIVFLSLVVALNIGCDAGEPCQSQNPDNTVDTDDVQDVVTPPLAWVECISSCRLSVTNELGFTQLIWDSVDPDIALDDFEFTGKIPVKVYAGLIFEIEVFGEYGDNGVYGGAFVTMGDDHFIFQQNGRNSKVVSMLPQPGVVQVIEVIRYLY